MTPANHPEEELAAYVGGSASGEEHALVERHLVSCAACRSEVRLAQTARDALRRLPTLEAPGIAAALRLPEGEPTGGAVVSLDERRSRTRWQRVTVALGAAAAASVVAAALILHVGAPNRTSPASAQGGAQHAQGTQNKRALSAAAPDYTALSLAALARQLQTDQALDERPNPMASTPNPAPLFGSAPASVPPTETGSSCLQEAAGMANRDGLRFFQIGSFEGTPAYIGAFLSTTGGHKHLVVVAASRDGCRALDVISERL